MVHGTSEERWAKRQRATPPRLAPSQPPSMRQLAGDCPQATRLCAGGELTRGVLKLRRRHWCTAELTELRLAHWSRTDICGVLALALALAAPKVCRVAPGCTQLRFCLDGHGWVLSRRVCAGPPSTATARLGLRHGRSHLLARVGGGATRQREAASMLNVIYYRARLRPGAPAKNK